ncbi:hypothetical protein R70723_04845 [Paenibacillus sp. FSL R7-0273]|uniref:hypothetical protein n=1 Tax=Paenibacillus sp. FSL R7-0273 TaxID=1536772 RepID=UPI0004F61419|nr:hypothetical protein [Paenibacillus sp. FSL R7-0273]AIQ45298.1 hypothetical protein R70723_04845 [Paenibacillus sp. FSL R7-0273]OMF88917.1 hypothetical protein BK144_20860 [Paenibacillus sp. FSL R7-0273]
MIHTKKAAVAAVCLSMLLSAVAGTAGAAGTLPDKLKNKSNGIMVTETAKPAESSSIDALLIKVYEIPLKAGEMRAVYVNDAKINKLDSLNISYMPFSYTSVSKAAQKLSAMGGGVLMAPSWLPKEYALKDATISPDIPLFYQDEYMKLRDEFKQKSTATGQKVVSEMLPWSGVETWLTYTRKGEELSLRAEPASGLPAGITLALLPGDKDEQVQVNGQEMMLTSFGPHHGKLKSQLQWSSADGSVEYTLTDTRNTVQSKAELLDIAGSLTPQ